MIPADLQVTEPPGLSDSASALAASVGNSPTHDLRAELLSLIATWHAKFPGPLDDDTCLISSGAFDSLALVNLILWVEEKTGSCIDPASVDLVQEWDSVRLILQFLERSPAAITPTRSLRQAKRPTQRPAQRGQRIQIVKYAATYKSAVADLQIRLWGPDVNLNLKYLDWKYLQNPYDKNPRIYLALDHGEVVGMRGFYPSRWEAGLPMQVKDVLVADDFVLRKDHENEGLVTQIMREALDDLAGSGTDDYVFNLSANQLTVMGSLAMAWRSTGCMAKAGRASGSHILRLALRKQLPSLPFLWRYADSSLLALKHPFRHLDRRLGVFTTAKGVAVTISADPLPFAMARLVESQGYHGRLRHIRDEDYFHWRFRNPLAEHRFFYVGDNSLDGYVVAKCSNPTARSSPRVTILDMEARDDRTGAALLDAVLHAGRFDELVVWLDCLRPRFRAMLEARKFKPADQHLGLYGLPRILIRSIDDAGLAKDWQINGLRLPDLENWDMRLLYLITG